ncbi:hypothetical protein ACQ4PT_010989 [Festuca glaucescens]
MELVGLCNGRLHELLCSMTPGTVHAIVMDALSAEALGVAEKLGVPGYIFQTANAGALSFFLHLPWIREEGQPSFKEMGDAIVELPGLAPMPASHLEAQVLQDPESETYKAMVSLGLRWYRSDGFIVNTFESLDARAVSALRHPRRLPPGVVLPPLYYVGPLVQKASERAGRTHECLTWLDGQPDRSVVFLCFGSLAEASHSEEQIKEIAVGLERSGHRFLWVVRDPLNANDDPDLGVLLPEGFVERTEGRGLVVKVWAQQVDVLQHRATGAFATHCGWNSVLKGVTAGVPMVAWPLYAEQRMNKVLLVEDLRVAVEMVGWRQGLVRAEEVEAKSWRVLVRRRDRALLDEVRDGVRRLHARTRRGGQDFLAP